MSINLILSYNLLDRRAALLECTHTLCEVLIGEHNIFDLFFLPPPNGVGVWVKAGHFSYTSNYLTSQTIYTSDIISMEITKSVATKM